MTIALVAYYLGPRLGIGNYLDRLLPPLVEGLDRSGIDVQILSSPNAFENTPALQQLSKRVTVLPELDKSPGQRYLWLATQFRQYCHQADIELVVWLSNPVVLPWHPLSIAVLHDVNEWKAKEKYGGRLRTALRSLIYLDASIWFSKRIIAVSQATKQDLLSFRPQLEKTQKLKAISNGSDSELTELPAVSIPASSHPFLLSVGRIDPAAKRLYEALKIAGALRERDTRPWEIHFVGGMNTSTQAEGETFLEAVNAADWAHYHGHVNDEELAQWYRQAAAVAYLSDNEGFGCPITEAASFKKWVVVSQINQATLEVGEGCIIPVMPEQADRAAEQVIRQLDTGELPRLNQALPTWKTSAKSYTEEITQVLRGHSL